MYYGLVIIVLSLGLNGVLRAENLFPIEPLPVACPEGETVPLEYGKHASCSIDSVTDLDNFVFEGTTGDIVRVLVRSNTTMDPWIEVRSPSDPNPFESTRCDGGCSITLETELTVSGMHTISLFEWGGDHTGPYLIQLEKVPPTGTQLSRRIPYDFPVNIELNPTTDHDFITFDGNDGTLVRVNVRSNSTMDPRLEAWDPSLGKLTNVRCDGGCTLAEELTLENSGTYLMSFSEWGKDHTGTIEISIQCVFGDCPTDIDQDGVVDLSDNCFRVPNTGQTDSDGDGFGNRCDADLDNDGLVNSLDLGLFKAVLLSSDPDADLNGDGIVNSLDLGLFKRLFLAPPGPSGLVQ